MGHDVGSEPGASFGFHNRQAEIDFGYRAVHLTVNAAKTLIQAYYGKRQRFSYHEGCSTGGREGLMEAQRFPDDFDGIIAGAPVSYYQQLNAAGVWFLQRIFRDRFAGALGFDTNGDGELDSLAKLKLLEQAVLKKCDGNDGVTDGVIDDPRDCKFDPEKELANKFVQTTSMPIRVSPAGRFRQSTIPIGVHTTARALACTGEKRRDLSGRGVRHSFLIRQTVSFPARSGPPATI